MSRFLLGFLLIAFGLSTQAATYATSVKMTPAREIKHFLNVSCSAGEELCEMLCQNQNVCAIEQVACVDCVSQTYRLFKTIFTELNENFKAQIDDRKSMVDMVEFLRHDRWLALSYDSFYNTFTPEHADKNKIAFNSMCPGSDREIQPLQKTDALILVKLDSALRPEKISHLICPSKRGTAAYGVEYHPDLTGTVESKKDPRRDSPDVTLVYELGQDP